MSGSLIGDRFTDRCQVHVTVSGAYCITRLVIRENTPVLFNQVVSLVMLFKPKWEILMEEWIYKTHHNKDFII